MITKGKTTEGKIMCGGIWGENSHMLFREQLFYDIFPGCSAHSDLYAYTLFLIITTKGNIYYFEITSIYYVCTISCYLTCH